MNTLSDIRIYDCTLREGAQSPHVSITLQDKLRITEILDNLGITYAEGGWPAANPKDLAYFHELSSLRLANITVVGFANTFTPRTEEMAWKNIRIFQETGIRAVHLFGKAWDLHVEKVLGITLQENLDYIAESICFYKQYIPEVSFGAEHLFDGYAARPDYVVKLVKIAEEAGADWIDLADTNGGSFPPQVRATVTDIRMYTSLPLAIHCHNDTGCAVANTMAAIEAGVTIAEGTINGYAERCRMTDLCTLIPNLQLKLGYRCIPPEKVADITGVARLVNEIVQGDTLCTRPYIGEFAFAHKAGLHVDAFLKNPKTYQHIDPVLVGNKAAILLSDQSGRKNLEEILSGLSVPFKLNDSQITSLLAVIKEQEKLGCRFDLCQASLALLVLRHTGCYVKYVELTHMEVIYRYHEGEGNAFDVTISLRINHHNQHGYRICLERRNVTSFLELANLIIAETQAYFPALAGLEVRNYYIRIINSQRQGQDRLRILLTMHKAGEEINAIGFGNTFIAGAVNALLEGLSYILNVHKRSDGEKIKKI